MKVECVYGAPSALSEEGKWTTEQELMPVLVWVGLMDYRAEDDAVRFSFYLPLTSVTQDQASKASNPLQRIEKNGRHEVWFSEKSFPLSSAEKQISSLTDRPSFKRINQKNPKKNDVTKE